MRADAGAGERGAAVQPDAGAARRPVGADHAGVRAEPVGRVLGGDAALQRRAAQPDRVLRQAEVFKRLAGRDTQLRLDQVGVGDLLGHRVLDLDARVHLDEHVAALLVDQELHGARVDVADLAGEGDGVGADPLPQLRVEVGRRGDFDDLLVAALHRAVPLEEVNHVTGGIGEDLHLDVPRLDDRLFQEDRRVAEGRFGFAHRGFQRLAQCGRRVHPAHAAPATAGDGLHEHRERHVLGGGQQLVDVAGRRRGVQHRHPGLAGGGDRGRLVPGHLQDFVAGTDEGDPGLLAGPRQFGILREEPVTGVDRVGAGLARGLDDLFHGQVGADRMTRFADLVRLVGFQTVQRVAVLVRKHRDRARA